MCVIATCGCGNLHENKCRKQDEKGAEWGIQLQGAAQLSKRAKQASQQQQHQQQPAHQTAQQQLHLPQTSNESA